MREVRAKWPDWFGMTMFLIKWMVSIYDIQNFFMNCFTFTSMKLMTSHINLSFIKSYNLDQNIKTNPFIIIIIPINFYLVYNLKQVIVNVRLDNIRLFVFIFMA